MNYTDRCTVTRRTRVIDPATGTATYTVDTPYTNVRCSFSVLGASEAVESFGENATPAKTSNTTASLRVPSWVPALPEDGYTLDSYSVSVIGYRGSYRIEAAKLWPDFSTYLACNP